MSCQKKQAVQTGWPEFRFTLTEWRPAGDQIRDRIDIVYFSRSRFVTQSCLVIGESKKYSEKPFQGKWPSDHRAVYAELRLLDPDK